MKRIVRNLFGAVVLLSSATNAFFIRDDLKNKFTILDPVTNFKKPIKYSDEDYIVAKKFLATKALVKI